MYMFRRFRIGSFAPLRKTGRFYATISSDTIVVQHPSKMASLNEEEMPRLLRG